MSDSFLQSKEWMDFQRSLGRVVLEYDKEGISAKIIKRDISLGKNYLYIPHGPSMDFNKMTGGFRDPVKNFIKYLKELAHRHKSVFIRVEPLADNVAQLLAEAGFKRSKKEIQPGKTVIIDLEGEELDMLGRMHHKTRYNIKVAEKHEIKVKESRDLNSFLELLKQTTERDNFSSHSPSYYQDLVGFFSGQEDFKVRLFLASEDDKDIAGAIVLVYGETGYYLHGASDYKFRSMMAPHMLHWQIIRKLREEGVKYYDLWGIDASRWPGVTRFKLGWGGRTVEHPGSFDMKVSFFWYLMYGIVTKIRK
ncbi:MAG: peptidoglycan bridge formation glycyltransferase FemA/FemB family protein [Candidatus Paceibacterota bacterium]